MDKKQKQFYVIGIIVITVYSIIMFYFSALQHIAEWYKTVDSDLKHLLTTITVTGLGLTLFAIRHAMMNDESRHALPRNKRRQEILEHIQAWDLALFIVIPSVEAFTYIVKIPTHWPWAVLVYIGGVMMWFVIVMYLHKISTDPKEEKRFTFSITYVMIVFVVYGTYAVWAFISLSQYMQPLGQV